MSSPPWPHTFGGMTAHIDGLNSTEDLPIFRILFEAIDELMLNDHNSYAYVSALDGASAPINDYRVMNTFDGMLHAGITDLVERLAYYSYADAEGMNLQPTAKSAITKANGSYDCRDDFVSVTTPGGWQVVYPS